MTKAPDPAERRSIGGRIRRIRKAAGLRQWQMAQLIGATQPSVCMYERGVLPDPGRLLSIARLGGTTVEWILTGAHTEGGSDEMERLPPSLYSVASLFHGISEENRSRLTALMDRIRLALASLEEQCSGGLETLSIDAIARKLEKLPLGDRRALCAAVALQDAVRRAFFARGMRSLLPGPREGKASRGPLFVGSRSLEPLKGPLFRLDPGLLKLVEILEDPEGRAEVERLVSRLSQRKVSGRNGPQPRRHAGRAVLRGSF